MKFAAKEDIEAPIEEVFRMASDFDAFERSALRRGAEVQRVDARAQPGVGMLWDVAFPLRGKRREMRLELEAYEPSTRIQVDAGSPSMSGKFVVDLMALSRSRTRMSFDLELNPRNLSARLLIQSLKLARSNLTKRFKLRVAEHAKDMEERYKRSAQG